MGMGLRVHFFILLFLKALFLVPLLGCRHSTEPPPPGPDTTSHNFVWTMQTLGDGASSYLNDVAIINDTLAYAVGAIYKMDSTGHLESQSYNIVIWNGRQWETGRIWFNTICGLQSKTAYPASSLYTFGENDIWISMDGDQVAHWDGSSQTGTTCMPISFSIKKLWGEDPSSVYAVGNGGNILHYTKGAWQNLSSGTATDIIDIWGIVNRSGQPEAYCAVSSFFTGGDRKILTITNQGKVDTLNWSPQRDLGSVWTCDGTTIYACGDGLFRYSSGSWTQIPTTYYSHCVRGNNNNDVFVVGDYGFCSHYNGESWHTYTEFASSDVRYGSVAIKGNLVIMVGDDAGKAIITVGKR
jgi:hypothetical protein